MSAFAWRSGSDKRAGHAQARRTAAMHVPLDLQHPQGLNCVCTGVKSQHRPNLPKSIHRLLAHNLQSPSRHMSPEHSEKLGPTRASSLDGGDMLRHAACATLPYLKQHCILPLMAEASCG